MKINCWGVRRMLSEALDDALAAQRQELVDRHLASCSGCRQRYAQMQKQRAFLCNLPVSLPPDELEKRVRQTWHPLLRQRPSLRLYPYLPVLPVWGSVLRLRLVGYMAGFFLTVAGVTPILSFLGSFSLDYQHLSEPGVYSLMNHPNMSHGPLTANRGNVTYSEDTEAYAHTNLLAGTTRLNGYVLNRFADDEFGALHEDSLSVVTEVQPDGRSAIEGILHTPRDRMLFVRFSQLLSTSQINLPLSFPPASGKVIWSFCRVIVIS